MDACIAKIITKNVRMFTSPIYRPLPAYFALQNKISTTGILGIRGAYRNKRQETHQEMR